MGHAVTFLVKWTDKGGRTRGYARAGLEFAEELAKKGAAARGAAAQKEQRSKQSTHMQQRKHAQ